MSDTDKIKVPHRKADSRVEKAIGLAKRDGTWQRLLEMGFTSAEQTARGYNVPGGSWDFGYTHENKDGELISVLWGKYVG